MNYLRKQTFIYTATLVVVMLVAIVACSRNADTASDQSQVSTETKQQTVQDPPPDEAASSESVDAQSESDSEAEASEAAIESDDAEDEVTEDEVTEDEVTDADTAETAATEPTESELSDDGSSDDESSDDGPSDDGSSDDGPSDDGPSDDGSSDDGSSDVEVAEVEESETKAVESESKGGDHASEPNRLIDEKSPYLLQHAYNPVDWHPWGEEAFAKAAAEDKPIFLSIGYSTCHWCHVMKRESFEDEQVAQLMNDSFIAIKLDREERPDIDDIYMNVAQLMQTRGGWPLNVLLTPEQKPFFVATYIPRESRFQRVGMIELIPQINDAWDTRRDEILTFADQITNALQPPQMSQLSQLAGADAEIGFDTLETAYNQLSQRFDPVYGGFGTQPKFPSPHNMLFLLRYWQRTGDEQALEMVETTLKNMHRGGVYDQIGYGFHRYSTDERWKLPHFEKMLYDQAMLSMAYTETFQVTKDEEYERIARQIFTYVLRDMTDEEGAFFSAENADSAEVEGGEEEEGVFYFWTIDELVELLGEEDANLVITISGMTEEGNFLEEATGQPIGKNIIYWEQSLDESAAALNLTVEELETALEPIRQKIFTARTQRVYPSKDDKILTDWNGLMIAAFAKAGRAFDEPLYVEAAIRSADFILTNMRSDDGRLLHRYRDGEFGLQASIDDYTFMIWGLLELYEATFDLKYLEEALALNTQLQTHFWDETAGGFYFTPDDGEKLISRQKAIYDGAIPSGNSVAMLNLLRLGRITADADYEDRAADVARAFMTQLVENPTAHTQLMSAVEFGAGSSYEVIIVGEEGAPDTESLLAALNDVYVPNKVVLLRGIEDDTPLVDFIDYTKYYYSIDDRATAYVCQNYICEQPTNEAEVMVSLLVSGSE